jgi:hypothetical protein
MIFRGVGGDVHPNVPEIDKLLSERLLKRGYKGNRNPRESVFGSTLLEQARDYTGGQDARLFVVEPRAGALVTWIEGVGDMVLSLESHIRSMYWNRVERYNGRAIYSLIRDIAGDIGTVETYLSLKRQRASIAVIMDSYLDGINIKEVSLKTDTDYKEVLEGHVGEVWVTGPCKIAPYVPELHMEFDWATPRHALK